MTRTELAAELHRVASELEQAGQMSFGEEEAADQVAVPVQIRREFEIKRSKDGSRFKVEIEIKWTSAHATTADLDASAKPEDVALYARATATGGA